MFQNLFQTVFQSRYVLLSVFCLLTLFYASPPVSKDVSCYVSYMFHECFMSAWSFNLRRRLAPSLRGPSLRLGPNVMPALFEDFVLAPAMPYGFHAYGWDTIRFLHVFLASSFPPAC